jgi:hypothetical protein
MEGMQLGGDMGGVVGKGELFTMLLCLQYDFLDIVPLTNALYLIKNYLFGGGYIENDAVNPVLSLPGEISIALGAVIMAVLVEAELMLSKCGIGVTAC